MSKHVEYTESALADKECLIEALLKLGIVKTREEIRQGTDLVMRDYYGRPNGRLTADIVLPSPADHRRDIGFKKTDKGYVPVADHFDLGEGQWAGELDQTYGNRQPGSFLKALRREHNVASVYAEARKRKGVVKEQIATNKAGRVVRQLVVSW
jgi:hypothetical protein